MNKRAGDLFEGVYYTERDYLKGHIFIQPQFRNAMGLDDDIITQLEREKASSVVITVKNFPGKPTYYAVAPISKFRGGRRCFFGQKYQAQFLVPMADFEGVS